LLILELIEMTFKCENCSRTFATPYALKRHISAKHQYDINVNEGETEIQSNILNEEPGLWDDNDDFMMNLSEVIIDCYHVKINLTIKWN